MLALPFWRADELWVLKPTLYRVLPDELSQMSRDIFQDIRFGKELTGRCLVNQVGGTSVQRGE
jgi:hypothetical protein